MGDGEKQGAPLLAARNGTFCAVAVYHVRSMQYRCSLLEGQCDDSQRDFMVGSNPLGKATALCTVQMLNSAAAKSVRICH